MATLGWVFLGVAFLMLVMVANNSWPWVWAKIQSGIPQPGSGNKIVPTPPEGPPLTIPPEIQPAGPTPGTIVPTPPEGQPFVPPTFGQ